MSRRELLGSKNGVAREEALVHVTRMIRFNESVVSSWSCRVSNGRVLCQRGEGNNENQRQEWRQI
jgi:hypothetical protein